MLEITAKKPETQIEIRRPAAGRRQQNLLRARQWGGFDMAYAGKLFGAFQRLHSAQEFPGTALVWPRSSASSTGMRAHLGRRPGRRGAVFYFTL